MALIQLDIVLSSKSDGNMESRNSDLPYVSCNESASQYRILGNHNNLLHTKYVEFTFHRNTQKQPNQPIEITGIQDSEAADARRSDNKSAVSNQCCGVIKI
ncbi:unnamed protein product [Macrosiphum euphorbiae]|uniref:Uncharacterized protein n=1 Tax=Macrosiphum euphorbiae TaxID=13131 RepID=A0AAV0XFG6_9HEMI|nr:unnamed protein product [Macrosiphum euphorbiae]